MRDIFQSMKRLRGGLLLCPLLFSACTTTPVDVDVEALKKFVPATPLKSVDVVWGESVGADLDQFVDTVPLVDGDKLYLADANGAVRCMFTGSGKLIWQQQFDTQFTSGPALFADTLYMGTDDAHVYAINKDSGELQWRTRVSSEVLATPQRRGDRVVVRSGDGKVFGLQASDGKKLWSYDRNVPLLSLRGSSSPLLIDGRAVIGFANGKLVALELLDGKVSWEATVAVASGRSELERMVDVDGDLLYANGVIYAVTYQGRVAAVSEESGRIIWTRDMSAYRGPVLLGKQLYITDAEGQVWALDASTGATLWKQDRLAGLATTKPLPVGERLLVGDKLGNIYWLQQTDGSLLARLDAGQVLYRSGVEALADKLDAPVHDQFWPDLIGVAYTPQLAGEQIILSYRQGALVAIRDRDGH